MKDLTIKAVLFDMDGLMFDTETLAIRAWLFAAEAQGVTLNRDIYAKSFGRTNADIKRLFESEIPELDYDRAFSLVGRHMSDEVSANGTPVKAGLHELLLYLKEHGIRAIVATSSASSWANFLVAHAGLDGCFDGVVGGDMIKNGKPAPDIFLKAAAEAGVKPSECMVLEDSYAGIEAALKAGATPVMVPDLLPATERQHDCCLAILPTLADVIPLLEG